MPVEVLQLCPDGQLLVPWQTPAPQTSFEVHATPSLHAAVFGVFWHCPEVQASVVHGLLSLHCETVVHVVAPYCKTSIALMEGFSTLWPSSICSRCRRSR